MPASTLDPVKTAIRNVLTKNSSDNYLNSQLASNAHRVLYTKIEFEPAESYQTNALNDLKSKYIVLQQPTKSTTNGTPNGKKYESSTNNEENLTTPKHVLFPIENVQLGWSNNVEWSVGAGMMNMGNTCYLNSTLQALFHVPALVNWLLSDKPHLVQCEGSAGGAQSCCIICAVSKTLQASQVKNSNAIRPWLVYSKLRLVCRHLIPGRQEDAHEFLRYLVEAMEKAYILRFRNLGTLDSRSKETTPLNQILGGYLRSTVRCLECGHVSTTFQHFQDLLLDIRKVNTLDEALDLYFSKEKLDDMAYHCDHCKKKVLATKQFTLERAPMVLCIQLKRFSVSNNKITKQLTFKSKMDLTRLTRQKSSSPLLYQLVAMVTHMGPTVSCGHYTAVARAASGNYYVFDDSTVRQISQQTVLNTNAYIMLYEAIRPQSTNNNSLLSNSNKVVNKPEPKSSENESSTSKISTVVSPVSGNCSPKVHNEIKKSDIQQNGNGISTNGIRKSIESSDSEDSDKDTNSKSLTTNNTSLSSITSPSCSSSNSISSENNSSVHLYNNSINSIKKNGTDSIKPSLQANSKEELNKNVSNDRTHNLTKLVPYEVNDSSSSSSSEDSSPASNQRGSDSNNIISTKATVGTWQVSPTHNKVIGPSLQGQTGWKDRNESVNELIRMSHEGYTVPVSTWNGNRAQLDKQIANERREERKRCLNDNSDRGKVKHARGNNSASFQYSNPGYNPFQEYNQRKWQNDSHRSFYNVGQRHRYSGQRRGLNNHHHHNRHRDKFRH